MKRSNGVEVFLWIVVALGLVMSVFIIGYAVGHADQKVIPACQEDEHVTQEFTCGGDGLSNFENGYWHQVPPMEVSK